MKTTIPFTGFYCSEHSDILDTSLARIFEDRQGSGMHKAPYDQVNWEKVFVPYAKEYAERFAHETGIKGLVFESLESPREYNFSTDRIFCDIPLESVQELFDKVDQWQLAKVICEKFTPCDGWIPFYSANIEEWLEKPLEEWDHNEIGILIQAYIVQEHDGGLNPYELMHESGDDIIYNALTDKAKKYATFLYDSQESGKDSDELPDFEQWVKGE